MDTMIYFDVEDSISPPEAGCDDVVLFLAELLSLHGVKGCFHIIGDKARVLEARGRRDIIAAVARHDVSSHFNTGSVHPTTTELVAPADWDKGVRIALEREKAGFDELRRIFGHCSALTRHGGSYAPQIVAAAGQCGKMYHNVPFEMPGHRIFWFSGTLCTSTVGLINVREAMRGPGFFKEDTFADTPAFAAQLERFLPLMREAAKSWPFAALFGCHPVRLCATEFPCVNYFYGRTAATLRAPKQRQETEKVVMRKNFERFIAEISGVPGVRWVGLGDLLEKYGRFTIWMDAAVLRAYAQRVRESDDVLFEETFSPAELVVGLAEALVEYGASGMLPERAAVREVIGPRVLPGEGNGDELGWDEVVGVAGRFREAARGGNLPTVVEWGEVRITPAEALGLFAAVYDDVSSGRKVDRWTIPPRHPYPRHGDAIAPHVKQCKHWPVFPRDMDFGGIVELTKAQMWSLKPAQANVAS